MEQRPNIHLFQTSEHFYAYDVNMDDILSIPQEAYWELVRQGTQDSPYVANLKKQGYFKNNCVEEMEHPASPYLDFYLDHKLGQMILQITQSCNLRCEYCVYSGDYQNRAHTQKQMSRDTAQKAIDFFLAHSSDREELTLSFYGGEPLLRVKFMQECIDYCHTVGEGKRFFFSLTTNGTLLDDSVEDFLAGNNISVLFSLDGPESIHNYHRKFAKDGKGSYDILKRNVIHLQKRYPDYFAKSVRFNTVLDQRREFSCVDSFVSGEDWLRDASFSSSVITTEYMDEKITANPVFIAEQEYAYFEVLLSALGKIHRKHVSKLQKERWNNLVDTMQKSQLRTGTGSLPRKAHHGGPCVPGALRTFVTADGNFYPCERVSEISKYTGIGNVNDGFDREKILFMMNIGKISEKQCRDCWAFRYCGVCIRTIDGVDHVSSEAQAEACKSTKFFHDAMFKDYCVMTDLGFDLQAEEISL